MPPETLPPPSTPPGALDTVIRGLRLGSIANFASLIAGALVAGLGGRIGMNLAGRTAPAFVTHSHSGAQIGLVSIHGTMEVVQLGMLTSGTAAVLFLCTRFWFERFTKRVVLLWSLFGTLFYGTIIVEPDNSDYWILGSSTLIVIMFLILAGLFSLSVAGLIQWGERVLPTPTGTFGRLVVLVFALISMVFQVATAVTQTINRPTTAGLAYLLVFLTIPLAYLETRRPEQSLLEKAWVRWSSKALILGLVLSCLGMLGTSLRYIYGQRAAWLEEHKEELNPPSAQP
jgi:hypothetical protein